MTPRIALAVSVILVIALAGLFVFDEGRRSVRAVTVVSGQAYRGGSSASISTGTWVYGLTQGTEWIDSAGEIHQGDGWPSCVRDRRVSHVQFGSVDVSYGGASWRVVVWVRC